MNRRMIFSAIGTILIFESGLLLFPVIFAIIYHEKSGFAFLLSSLISLACGFLLKKLSMPKNHVIYAKDGFIIVAFAWTALSLVGALPLIISGEIPNFADALFETVSGFSTTGASVVTDLSKLSHAVLFWRSFTHWVGGMGIIVFVVAILPNVSERSMHILRAEMPGPVVGKLVPKAKDTAIILYIIYAVLTVLQIILLRFGGMPLFESIVHSIGTAGTGGFGIKSDSIASYSPYIQWVITAFMCIFSVNFNLYYLLLAKKFSTVAKSTELWAFIGIVLFSTVSIAVNIYPQYNSISESFRLSAFQTASVMSTTGYSTADFNLWPTFSKSLLLSLMFIGGCAGSTAGGIKVSRIVIMIKLIAKEIKHLLHPHSVSTVRFEGKTMDSATVKGINNYFLVYFACFFGIFLLLGLENFSIETNLSATISCFNNVGPGLGLVGPAGSYAVYSPFSKILLSLAMLLGRLEIFPVIIAFAPATWSKNK